MRQTDITIQVIIQNCKSNNRSCHRIQQRLRMINSLRVSGLTEVIMLELSDDVSGSILGMGVEGVQGILIKDRRRGQKHVEAWKGKREWELQLIKDYRIWWSWRFWQSQESRLYYLLRHCFLLTISHFMIWPSTTWCKTQLKYGTWCSISHSA